MKSYQQTVGFLETLKLKGVAAHLDELITDAEREKHSYLSFLNALFETEITDRRMRRLRRNLAAAHFPIEKRVEQFEFGRVKGIGKSEVVNLLDCSWIDRHENILFFGPPGVGKTHLAISLGLNAIDRGYTVCFERVNNLMRLLRMAAPEVNCRFS